MSDDCVHIYANPTAGRGRAGRRLAPMETLFVEAGLNVQLHTSNGIGDLERQVRRACEAGTGRIVVAGGDGSINEAVNGILQAGSNAALGVIPSGTGNDFAKAAGITLDWRSAARLLADRIAAEAPTRPIDAGLMNGRYFANGAGIGFDAKVTRLARAYRLPIGDLIYLVAVIRALAEGIVTAHVAIESENFAWAGPLTLINISNSPWVGGLFHIAPMAKPDDGVFEMLVAAPLSRRRILALLPKLMKGEHISEPEVFHTSTTRVHIEAEEPLPAHLDGEVQEPGNTFEIEMISGALRLI